MKSSFPELDPDSLAHSDRLKGHILNEIRKSEGKISFEQYMSQALYAPNLGYYVAGAKKFGAEGDFITAPEISEFFSRCIARNCLSILHNMPQASLLELGAGTGKMAAHILLELELLDCLPEKYFILELSPELKERQQQTITLLCPHLLSHVQWISHLPTRFEGIILANEVLDAMPVRRLCIEHHQSYEFFVTEKNGELAFAKFPLKPDNLNVYHQKILEKLMTQSSYLFEINEYLIPWLKSLHEILTKGVILIMDYGFPAHEFYHPDRTMGTLMCHFRHRAHSNYFLYPGLQDITAHVDFSLIAETAAQLNLDLLGFTNQASFLINSGMIDLLGQRPMSLSDKEKTIQNHAIQLLCSPAEMGELFKIIGLGKDSDTLPGFSKYDQRHRLQLF